VAAAPYDLALRGELLKHYFLSHSPQEKASAIPHILWIINNAPEADIAGSAYTALNPSTDPIAYVEARDAWLRQIDAHSDNPKVLLNAAQFLAGHDQQLAVEVLKRGAALWPGSARWHRRLANLVIYEAKASGTPDRRDSARLALAELESSIPPNLSPASMLLELPTLAELALVAEKDDRATAYATELLRLADQLPRHSQQGYAVHEGHRVLGHLALRRDDVEEAKIHLIRAGQTRGSASLDTFGPELTLAQALLARGEREVVIEYLRLCSRFWRGHDTALNAWMDEIRAGQTPLLDRFAAAPDGS